VRRQIHLRAEEGRLRALLHEKGHVLQSRDLENGDCELEVEFTLPGLARLSKQEPDLAQRLQES